MSLAEDITPPPGMQAPAVAENAPNPLPTATPMGPQFPEKLPDPNSGALTYAENCAPCHGETGQGDGPQSGMLDNPVAAIGSPELARQATPSDWYLRVTQGNMQKFMPPFASLSDQQRWDVVAYAFTLSVTPEELALGQALFTENCAECHGDGRAGEMDFSDLEWMSQTSTAEMFTALTAGHAEMPVFDKLDEADRWVVAAYVRSLSFIPFTESSEPEISEGQVQPEDSGTPAETVSGTPAEGAEQTPGFGNIQLNVVPTDGDNLPQNLEIILRGYEEMSEVYSQTVTLAEGTAVTFEEVPLVVGRMYFATIEHKNAAYGSDVVTIEPGVSDLSLEVVYYPPTTDTTILSVDRLHVFIDFVDDHTLEVFQLYIFSNPSIQVLTPVEGATTAINFVIPPAASNMSVEDNLSMAFRKTDDGFGIVNVYPDANPYQVVFSYQMPYPEKKLDLDVPIGMDANAVIVMAPANGFKLKSDQLVEAGTQEFEGVSYNMFNGSNLKTGTPLALSLSGRPKVGTNIIATAEDSNTSLVIGLAGFGLMLIGAGVYLWRRNQVDDVRLAEAFDGAYEDEIEAEIETGDDIIDAIIALDDQYKTGELPEGAYKVRRAELKEQLRELVG